MKINLTVPVYNEEKILAKNILILHQFLSANISDDWKIIIADNASTDKTPAIAESLEKQFPEVVNIRIEKKGRGYALKHVWQNYNADIHAYCDADLSTEIKYLPNLFDAIKNGNRLVAGSRYLGKSAADRTLTRLLISRVYIYLVKLFFKTQISDFQCGFKAVDAKFITDALPLVKNTNWFFDTEIILVAQKKFSPIKISEIAVNWKENDHTSVKFIRSICGFIYNLIAFRIRLWQI